MTDLVNSNNSEHDQLNKDKTTISSLFAEIELSDFLDAAINETGNARRIFIAIERRAPFDSEKPGTLDSSAFRYFQYGFLQFYELHGFLDKMNDILTEQEFLLEDEEDSGENSSDNEA